MDLNPKVCSVFSWPSSSINPMSRFTSRECSFRGTDITSNGLKTYLRTNAVTRGYSLIGIGLKVLSTPSDRGDVGVMVELIVVGFV